MENIGSPVVIDQKNLKELKIGTDAECTIIIINEVSKVPTYRTSAKKKGVSDHNWTETGIFVVENIGLFRFGACSAGY